MSLRKMTIPELREEAERFRAAALSYEREADRLAYLAAAKETEGEKKHVRHSDPKGR